MTSVRIELEIDKKKITNYQIDVNLGKISGSLWINFLQQLNHLSRLDFSGNLLTGRINDYVLVNIEKMFSFLELL